MFESSFTFASHIPNIYKYIYSWDALIKCNKYTTQRCLNIVCTQNPMTALFDMIWIIYPAAYKSRN